MDWVAYWRRVSELVTAKLEELEERQPTLIGVPFAGHFKVWHDGAGWPKAVTFEYQEAQPRDRLGRAAVG